MSRAVWVNRPRLTPTAIAVVVIAGCALAAVLAWATAKVRQGDGSAAKSATAGSGMRTAWGEPDLSGVWMGPKLGARPGGQDTFNLAQLEGLYRPEVRAALTQTSERNDPSLNCVPPAFPRAAVLGWPIQIIQGPGFAYVLTEAFHTFRLISTDGRPHLRAELRYPTFMGYSAGHWDGDTLVVDVVTFNGESWLAGGEDKPTTHSAGVWPTSDAMHVVERWRRIDVNTLEYQAVVEDPKMLRGSWESPAVALKRQPVNKIDEIKCYRREPDLTPDPATYLTQFKK